MVALLPARLWSFSVSEHLPCIHGLADMDTTIVYKVGLHHIMTAHLKKFRNRPSEKIVTDMSKVERLVGVRRGVFHHNGLSCCRKLSKILCRGNPRKDSIPVNL